MDMFVFLQKGEPMVVDTGKFWAKPEISMQAADSIQPGLAALFTLLQQTSFLGEELQGMTFGRLAECCHTLLLLLSGGCWPLGQVSRGLNSLQGLKIFLYANL